MGLAVPSPAGQSRPAAHIKFGLQGNFAISLGQNPPEQKSKMPPKNVFSWDRYLDRAMSLRWHPQPMPRCWGLMPGEGNPQFSQGRE